MILFAGSTVTRCGSKDQQMRMEKGAKSTGRQAAKRQGGDLNSSAPAKRPLNLRAATEAHRPANHHRCAAADQHPDRFVRGRTREKARDIGTKRIGGADAEHNKNNPAYEQSQRNNFIHNSLLFWLNLQPQSKPYSALASADDQERSSGSVRAWRRPEGVRGLRRFRFGGGGWRHARGPRPRRVGVRFVRPWCGRGGRSRSGR